MEATDRCGTWSKKKTKKKLHFTTTPKMPLGGLHFIITTRAEGRRDASPWMRGIHLFCCYLLWEAAMLSGVCSVAEGPLSKPLGLKGR